MGGTRVLLADDAPEILARVTELLQSDFDVIGSAQNGAQAMDAAAKLNPDLVVLDISMPILNGIQVASRLRQAGCRAKVIFLTVHDDQDYVEAAFSVGAQGYVLKPRLATDLIPAIKWVLQGHRYTSPLAHASAMRGGGGLSEPTTLLVAVPESE